MRRALSFLGLVLLFTPAVPAADHGAPAGFTPLFDGKTLSGWKMVNTKDNFYAKEGVLVMDRGKGWLATEKTFADFELRLRYRFVTPGTDSGVFIRSSLEGSNWTNHGYQIQNMDNHTLGQVIGMGVKVASEDRKHDEDLVKKVKKPSGEWLDLTIRAVGKTVKVSLNGQEVATGDNLSVLDGHIGLQAEGGVIEFQRIDIKPLRDSTGAVEWIRALVPRARSRSALAPRIALRSVVAGRSIENDERGGSGHLFAMRRSQCFEHWQQALLRSF